MIWWWVKKKKKKNSQSKGCESFICHVALIKKDDLCEQWGVHIGIEFIEKRVSGIFEFKPKSTFIMKVLIAKKSIKLKSALEFGYIKKISMLAYFHKKNCWMYLDTDMISKKAISVF